MENKEFHEKVLYPIVRVKAVGAGGSGVLIYSGEDSKNVGKYINIVLTCEHVKEALRSILLGESKESTKIT